MCVRDFGKKSVFGEGLRKVRGARSCVVIQTLISTVIQSLKKIENG